MAIVALTPTKITGAGVTMTLTAANAGVAGTDGNSFTNTPDTWLEVNNGDGSSHTMTVAFEIDGATVTRTYTIAAGARKGFRFDPTIYGGNVKIGFDAVTSITLNPFYL